MRLSGTLALSALAALTPGLKVRPRRAHFTPLTDPADGALIDHGLVLAFPGPASFTGEDVVELQVHGGPTVIERLFAALGRLGLKPAGPGDFSRRAFMNGKMDLTVAEGLADLVAADSEAQRRQALEQMGGAWSRVILDWQVRLTETLALLEAGIDFVDEDDVPDGVTDSVPERLIAISTEMMRHLQDARRGEIVRDGLRVAIVGPPNVGKSTLLNALAGRDAAIVSDIPGTTRDIVEVRLDLDGYVVVVADTAGLRESEDRIEQEGVRRARLRAEDSDVRVFVMDSAARVGLETYGLAQPDDIAFLNKTDLGAEPVAIPAELQGIQGSALHGRGLEALTDALRLRIAAIGRQAGSIVTRARHRQALAEAHAALSRAVAAGEPDLVAEDVRLALRALAGIVGHFDVEQVLDRIFSSFCIGK